MSAAAALAAASYVPKSVTMFIAITAFVFAALMLSYFATNIDTIKKLDKKESVADSSIKFLNGMSAAGLVVAILAVLYFAFAMWKLSSAKR